MKADLAWTIPKARRVSGARAGGFPGADVIGNELELGVKRRRIGLQPDGKTIVREGAELVTSNGDKAGVVTSGGFGPTLERPIAMAYIRDERAAHGLSDARAGAGPRDTPASR